MKKHLLSLATATCFLGPLMAQCPLGPIELNTQAEVDNFVTDYPGCTATEDALVIGSSSIDPIVDLSPLGVLVFVKGGLVIQGNSMLNSLVGLDNVTAVGGDLDIAFNSGLMNLSALENLSAIGGSLSIFGNENITGLTGLHNVANIGGGLTLFDNVQLNDISAFENTTFMGNLLFIFGNPALSLCANTGICNFLETLDLSTEVFIGSNAAGCLATGEVQAACAALPVELLYFHARPGERSVELTWHTVSEIGNDRFEVEYSPDGRQFSDIGMVKGRGTSTVPHTYTFIHHRPRTGLNYYRLRQIDFDGGWEHSPVVVAFFDGTKDELSIFPNPVRDVAELRGTNLEGAPYQLTDAVGRIVQRGTLGSSRIDLSRLTAGVYVLLLQPKDGAPVAKRLLKE